ncbi:unnamed protein product [Caenorhabditis brenneri]
MQPIPLSPLLAGYCNGFLATHLKIWTHYLVSFLTTSFVAQIECLVFCFIRKHQTIARLNYRHILTDAWYVFGTLLAVSVPIFIGVLLSVSGMPREDQMGYIKESFPEYFVSFQSLPNFVIYAVNFRLILILTLTIIGGLLCGIIFILLTTDMLKMLKKIQRKVSVVSFRRYQIAVTSLLAQFFTSFLLSVPLFLFLVLAASQAEHSHGAAKILVAVMPLYSVVNALVLVFTTPPYRNFVLRKNTKHSFTRQLFSVSSQRSLTRIKSFFS